MPRPRPKRRSSAASTLLVLLAAVAAWYLVAPSAFGGRNDYVVTSGISMLPNFHSGDFVVVRKAASYQIGDIIAYHWKRELVLHRIVDEEDGSFVMKGDNNSYLDTAKPAPADVAGRLWIHIPGAGRALTFAKQPGILAAAAFVITITTLLGSEKPRRRRRGERTVTTNAGGSSSGNGSVNFDALAIAGIAALGALIAAIIAFSHPVQRMVQAPVPYQQSGAFSYSAQANGGVGGVYENGQVANGEPVYFKLVRVLDLGFDYRFSSKAPHRVQGTYQLTLEISQGSAWKRTAVLVPETPFQGDHVAIASTLDLQAIQAVMNNFELDTGGTATGFTATVVPQIALQGSLAGAPLKDQFAPKLAFRVDAGQMSLDSSSGSKGPLQPSQSGSLTRPRLTTSVLSLAFLRFPVLQARVLSLLALTVSLAGGAILALPLLAARKGDEPARIRARYGGMLLDVHGAASAIPDQRIVDLLRPDDLAKVAEREGRMILHRNGSATHQYMVSDGEIVYRYQAQAAEAESGPRRNPWKLSRR